MQRFYFIQLKIAINSITFEVEGRSRTSALHTC